MNSVQVRGLTLAYRAAGDPAKPALILLHGWPHSSAIYENVVRDLASEAYVLAFDLPEIGDSRGAPPSSEKIVLADLLLLGGDCRCEIDPHGGLRRRQHDRVCSC